MIEDIEKRDQICPLVSCIITTYKRPKKILKRALESVINQTYENLEIILVNDDPENKEMNEYLQKYTNELSRHVKFIYPSKNLGPSKIRNYAVKQAIGEYIAFLDDDDEWNVMKIEKMVGTLRANNYKSKMVYSNSQINYLNNDGELVKSKTRFSTIQPSGNIYSDLLKENLIGSCSFPMIKKSVFEEYGGFSESLTALEDWDLYINIAQKYEIDYVDCTLNIYYFHKNQRVSDNFSGMIDAYHSIETSHLDYFKENEDIYYFFLIMGTYFYSINSKFSTAYYLLFRMITIAPFNFNNIKTFSRITKKILVPPKYV